jgi:hypothetical protein
MAEPGMNPLPHLCRLSGRDRLPDWPPPANRRRRIKPATEKPEPIAEGDTEFRIFWRPLHLQSRTGLTDPGFGATLRKVLPAARDPDQFAATRTATKTHREFRGAPPQAVVNIPSPADAQGGT